MTLLLDVPATVALLQKIGVPEFLLLLTKNLEEDYGRWQHFHHRPRVAYDAEVNGKAVGVLELMPTCDDQLFTFKYVNGHPQNTAHNKLCVVAFGCLADVPTGYPQLIAEMTLLTALRTAATSALAAKYAMPRNARHHAIIGTGAQAEFQVLAMSAVNGLNTVSYYDKDPAAMEKFARNMARYSYLSLRAGTSVADTVRGAHVVTTATATKGRAEIVAVTDVKPGMHFNAIGGDCPGKTEFSVPVLEQCKILVEYEPQTQIEGEIQQLPISTPVSQLCDVVSGKVRVRSSEDDITLYDSVGFSLEDFSVLRLVLGLAKQHKLGSPIALVPELKDPKDLFGLLV